jgi:hypothetical protein
MKFSSIDYSIFIPFLCILEQQRAPSPPVSSIYGDGDATATPINGGDLPISDASKPMTFVLRYFPLTKKKHTVESSSVFIYQPFYTLDEYFF